MPPDVINLADKLAKIEATWSPRVVAALNDYQVKVAKLEGRFVWHDHEDTDELFLVLRGRLRIELPDGELHLAAGELCVVPRGVAHRPTSEEGCHVLLIEPRGVVNTGGAGGPLTAEGDAWA